MSLDPYDPLFGSADDSSRRDWQEAEHPPEGDGGPECEIRWIETGPPPVRVPCWRCGKMVDEGSASCGFCLAPQASEAEGEGAARPAGSSPDEPARPLLRLLVVFGILEVTSILLGFVTEFGLKPPPGQKNVPVETLLGALTWTEAIDTIVVVAALFWVSRPQPQPLPGMKQRLWSWLLAAPALAAALAINHGYHEILRSYLAAPRLRDELIAETGLSPWIWLTFCLQPAIVEELFFRYLALGTLRRYCSVNAAVWVSSIMFGMAHIGVPASIPVLTLIGVLLGYARVASGSMALPMLLHFVHNAVVIFINN